MRRTVTALLVCVVSVVAACSTSAPQNSPSSPSPSTATAASTSATAPVTVRPGPGAVDYPAGTRSEILTYTSEDPQGRAVATTGLLLVPPGTPPQGGWPIVAWGHGTTGIGDTCAPSTSPGAYYGATLGTLVGAGYAVAATDYVGLGTPGTHPYLIADSEARSMTDMVDAARSVTPDLGEHWVAVGHSQGGQAAWGVAERMTGRETPTGYRGAVALAPAPNFSADLQSAVSDDPLVQQFYLMTLVGLATTGDLDYTRHLGPDARALLPATETQCFDDLTRTVAERRLPRADFVPRDPTAAADLARQLVPHELAHRRSDGPLLVLQGTGDEVVLPDYTRQMVAMARRQGTTVDYAEFPGASHGGLLDASRDRVLSTLASLLR